MRKLDEKLIYTIQDLMDATGLSRSFIYAERERGKLIFRKAAGRTVILAEDVKRYISNFEIAA